MAAQYTPTWGTDAQGYVLTMGDQVIVSSAQFKPDHAPLSEGMANIALAAAAPELLEALKAALLPLSSYSAYDYSKARAAIQRATGEKA